MWLRAQAVPKPCPDAQAREQGARKVWLSDVFATAKSPPLAKRGLQKKDWEYAVFMAVIHGLCLLAPFTFSWQMVGLFFVSYFITGADCLLSSTPAAPNKLMSDISRLGPVGPVQRSMSCCGGTRCKFCWVKQWMTQKGLDHTCGLYGFAHSLMP